MAGVNISIFLLILVTKCSAVTDLLPCQHSPCGPNSQCREINGEMVCSCLVGFIGSPPLCRPTCSANNDCPPNKVCINDKCYDPCVGSCGVGARCQVVNHNPMCSCPTPYTGDPFVRCTLPTVKPELNADPCIPSPCGSNSICKEVSGLPKCSCQTGFNGSPPHCKPECLSDSECPIHLACINRKCENPCSGACGVNADCNVTINLNPWCFCRAEYTGDPYKECYRITRNQEVSTPCQPSPCGPNAICKEYNGAGSCICQEMYSGDSYVGCRPECVMNTDCSSDKACVQNKCQYPCNGACAPNALCKVVDHAPACSCNIGYTGDPSSYCALIERCAGTTTILITIIVTMVLTSVLSFGIFTVLVQRRFSKAPVMDHGLPNPTVDEPHYEIVDSSNAVSQRAPCPLPAEELEENKKYVHYDTPYEWRIWRIGVNPYRRAQRKLL